MTDASSIDHAVAAGRVTPWAAMLALVAGLDMPALHERLTLIEVAYNGKAPRVADGKDAPGDSARQMDIDALRALGLHLTGRQRAEAYKVTDEAVNAAVHDARKRGFGLTDPSDYPKSSAFAEAGRVLEIGGSEVKRRFYALNKIKRREAPCST